MIHNKNCVYKNAQDKLHYFITTFCLFFNEEVLIVFIRLNHEDNNIQSRNVAHTMLGT